MKFNIRLKILIAATLLLILSSVVQALSLSIAGAIIYAYVQKQEADQIDRGIKEIQTFFVNLNTKNFVIAKTYELNSLNSSSSAISNINHVINATLVENRQFEAISVLTPDGHELLKYVQDIGNVPPNKLNPTVISDEFKKARDGKTTFSKVYIQEQPNLYIDIYTPVFIKNKVPAIIKMQVNLKLLKLRLNNIKLDENGYIYVVDNTGRLISHPSKKYISGKQNLSDINIIKFMLKNRQLITKRGQYENQDKKMVMGEAVRVPAINWIVVFEQPVSEVLGFTYFLRDLFIVNLAGSLFILILIALVLSENLTRPIIKLMNFTQLLEKGHLDNKIKINTGDEIESLANSFNSMAVHLLQREDNLKKQEQEKEAILQSLTEGIFAVNTENKIILFNKEAEKITGFAAESILNKNIDEVLRIFEHEQQVTFDQYKNRTRELTLKLNEKGQFMKNATGEKHKISLITTTVNSDDPVQNRWVITIHDMRKEQELEEMKVDFVTMAAHELRTPMSEIRGFASLLKMQGSGKLDETEKDLLDNLIVSSNKLNSLIDNLLSISRVEQKDFGMKLNAVSIEEIIKNVTNGFKHLANTSMHKIVLELPREALPKVSADYIRIGQVLSNLMINALDYTPKGSVISVKAVQKDNFIEVSVSDNGPGIPKETMPKLFQKFFRVSEHFDNSPKGKGLGLFICKSIIEMHKGKIRVESEPGKLTVFAFTLPIAV